MSYRLLCCVGKCAKNPTNYGRKGLAYTDFLCYNIHVAKKHVCGEPQWCRKSADGFEE